MNSSVKFFVALACVSAVAAAPAGAQNDACDVDQNSPQFVARAYFSIQKGIGVLNNKGDPAADARAAVRLLTDPAARDHGRDQSS